MDFTNDWNYIVDDYNKNFNEPETIVQDKWEIFASEILGYKKISGEITSKQSMTIGSHEKVVPDIVIQVNQTKFFDIELKQYNLPFDIKMQEQLKSYLKLLNLSLGLVICQKIYLFYYDYNNDFIEKTVIDFTKNNEDGIYLLSLLHKLNFNKDNIIKFIKNKEEKKKHITEIEQEINEELVKDLLKKHFLQNYSEIEIDKVLNKTNIIINNNKAMQPNPVSSLRSKFDDSKHKDYTCYQFNGRNYNKRRLVLAVVNYYISCHPGISYNELLNIFNDKLQGSLGVIADERKFQSKSDYKNRFFCNPEEIIHLNNEKIYVCNQWGTNIGNFIKLVTEQLGYKII